MKKSDIVKTILGERIKNAPQQEAAQFFAPANIALCKYWGKRNAELNLPMTSSLSISLGEKGTTTAIKLNEDAYDLITFNNQPVDLKSNFGVRLIEFLDLFRTIDAYHFRVDSYSNIPVAAGLASSASGFASLILALNQLFGWDLRRQELSILARLGSGSACRSITPGFVEWHAGLRDDGMDSYGEAITEVWRDLCVGLLILSTQEKPTSSRDAMQRTVATSPLYSAWPAKVHADLSALKKAISVLDFDLLGKTAESNAMTMHAMMLAAWPPVSYFLPDTISAMQKIWQLRADGLAVYFTQDAGPNLKLLFLERDLQTVRAQFPTLEVVQPFGMMAKV